MSWSSEIETLLQKLMVAEQERKHRLKELIADAEGHVEGLEALYPPGTVVYIDEAGHYAGHESPTMDEQGTTPPKSRRRIGKDGSQLQDEPA